MRRNSHHCPLHQSPFNKKDRVTTLIAALSYLLCPNWYTTDLTDFIENMTLDNAAGTEELNKGVDVTGEN